MSGLYNPRARVLGYRELRALRLRQARRDAWLFAIKWTAIYAAGIPLACLFGWALGIGLDPRH